MRTKSSDRRSATGGFRNEAEDLVRMLRSYAQQELVDPLRTLARFIGFGLLGAVFVATSALLFAVALLRVLQEEASIFDGNWSFVPYIITTAFCVLVLALAVMRIGADKREHEEDDAANSQDRKTQDSRRKAQ